MRDSRVRVLRVIARMNMGGPAYHVSLLSGLLDPERYRTLLVAGEVGPGEKSAAGLANRYGADLKELNSLGPEINLARDGRAFRDLAGLVRRFRPDIVHTHTAKAGFIGRTAAIAASRAQPIVVHTYHGHVLEGYFGRARTGVYRRIESLLGRRSDCLIGVSDATVADLVRLGIAPRSKFASIPLGLDLTRFLDLPPRSGGPLRTEFGLTPQDILVTYVGRFVPVKQLELLLRVVARASRTVPLHLAMVGGGDQERNLERLAAVLGIADRVHFLGYRDELRDAMQATDIAMLTSRNEGTPVFLIEASASARPAVATAVGGVTEVVRPETGIAVRPTGGEREEKLAEALVRLARDPGLRERLGIAAREHVRSRYAKERLLADIDALYQELLAARR